MRGLLTLGGLDSLIFVDTAMHRGSDRTACEVTIFRSREMCYTSNQLECAQYDLYISDVNK